MRAICLDRDNLLFSLVFCLFLFHFSLSSFFFLFVVVVGVFFLQLVTIIYFIHTRSSRVHTLKFISKIPHAQV